MEGHGFRNVPISLADIHFPGSRRNAHGTACYSLSSRITGDRSRAAAASIAPVAHPFGVYRKSQISPAWCRNRSLGGAQNRSRRALPRGLARWRASTGTAAIVNRLARTLLGHGHRDYRLRHRRVFSLRARSYYARVRDSRPHRRTMVAQRTGEPLGALGGRDLRSPVLAFTSRLAWNETLSYLRRGAMDRALGRQRCHGAFLQIVSHQQRRTIRQSRVLHRRTANGADRPTGGPRVRLDLHPPGP